MNKKIKIILLIIILLYVFLAFQARYIQTLSTFPAIWSKLEYKYDETLLKWDNKYEEINVDDWKWNNINWLYIWTWTWKTVYYFHWNWWPLNYFYSDIKYINELWYNVFAFDYPWYWKSTWFPYKENVDNFSQKFYDFVKKEKNIKDEELIIWWYSIWTAVAVDFASKNKFDKLVLISPFSSRYDMSEAVFWFRLNKYLFLDESYNTKSLVKWFDRPFLLIHWNKDKIVPFEQWKKVFKNYAWGWLDKIPNKYFIEIDNFWHNWIIDTFWEALKYKIWNFLKNWEIKFNDEYILLDKNWIKEDEEKKDIIREKIKKKIERKRKMYLFLNKNKLKELEKENKIREWLKKDDSLTKFVNNKEHLNNKPYIPNNLVFIKSDFIIDAKWNQQLRKEAFGVLNKMAEDFYNKFNKKIVVVSAYRSYIYQKWIKDRGCPDNLCAKAGYSEHQLWLAVDLWEASTQKQFLFKYNKYYNWLNENAANYGFHNTYQKWLEVDWYEIEPWHWRYLWIKLAKYLKDNNLTFAEYYKNY